MKQLTTLLISLWITSQIAAAQTINGSGLEVAGHEQLEYHVNGPLDDTVLQLGLTRDRLGSRLELKLGELGIRASSPPPGFMAAMGPDDVRLYVSVSVVVGSDGLPRAPAGNSFLVQLSFERGLTYFVDDEQYSSIFVAWQQRSTGEAGSATDILEGLDQLLDEFRNAYLKTNVTDVEARLEERRAQVAREDDQLNERRALAEEGDVFEQYFLGLMLRNGRYVPKDEVESAHWLRRAADQGMASAQYALGILLTSHSTTEPLHTSPIPPERLERMSIREQLQIEDELEHAEALRWFRSAADGGYPDALSALAYAYFYGEPGVPQDYVQAYVWGSIAANNLNPGNDRDVTIQLRDEAASRLTVVEKAEGDRLVQEWSEAHETRYDLPGMLPPPPPR
jgi:hypothetical protein